MLVNGIVLYLRPEALAGAEGKIFDILRGDYGRTQELLSAVHALRKRLRRALASRK